ncbi:class I SAM-dependent methyltransferase [Flavobacteriaceae bacterium TK19130]|nr:class I SAM-dependent methyltransferase [Thermobacterium salinum]
MKIDVHDTALMIAWYRAANETASLDPYAKFWFREGAKILAEDFEAKVSEHEGILHGMRNRFMLGKLKEFQQLHPKESCCINLGAGFSMYPYLLQNHWETLEIDFNEVVQYKDLKTAAFQKDNKIPTRTIDRMVANFLTEEGQGKIRNWVQQHPSKPKIFIIEGVFYFLSVEEVSTLLRFCRSLMKPGDQLACNSYRDAIKQTQAFEALQQYFREVLNTTDQANTTLADTFYRNLDGFLLEEVTSTFELAKENGFIDTTVSETVVLNEYCYSLRAH